MRVTSVLTIAESNRALLRAHLAGIITDEQHGAALQVIQRFARRCHVVRITEPILSRASRRFPVEPIRTLDAIHLATAEALGNHPVPVIIVTRDRRIEENARAAGYSVE